MGGGNMRKQSCHGDAMGLYNSDILLTPRYFPCERHIFFTVYEVELLQPYRLWGMMTTTVSDA